MAFNRAFTVSCTPVALVEWLAGTKLHLALCQQMQGLPS